MPDDVTIRALRADLAAHVRRAGAGERVVVRVHGRPVAQLGPLDPAGVRPTLTDLAARGLVRLPARADRPPAEPVVVPWPGARLDRLVRELRG